MSATKAQAGAPPKKNFWRAEKKIKKNYFF
jgi:hypothetical protein